MIFQECELGFHYLTEMSIVCLLCFKIWGYRSKQNNQAPLPL